MAKAPATPKAEAAGSVPIAPQRSKKLLIIAVTLVVVAMLLFAGVAGLLMLKKAKGGEHAEDVETSEPFDLSKPPTFVALEPFVANLAPDEGDRYLQVVLALRVGDAKTGEMLGGFMPEIRHQINLLLTSKLPSELSTPDGREILADEIVARTNAVLGGSAKSGGAKAPQGPIQAVFFNSFIIQ